MQTLYNSDNFVVVQFDVPDSAQPDGVGTAAEANGGTLTRGGYEIVDKFARKGIFIEGVMAQSFKEGVEALIETRPTEDDMDDYIGRYTSLMQQTVILH